MELISTKMKVTIIDYQPQYQLYFKNLNRAWLEEYCTAEDVDRRVLKSPQTKIIDPGEAIHFALLKLNLRKVFTMEPTSRCDLHFLKVCFFECFLILSYKVDRHKIHFPDSLNKQMTRALTFCEGLRSGLQ